MTTAGPTGSSFNSARTFGPYVMDRLFGGHVRWAEYPVYVIGPVLGASVAAWLYSAVAGLAAPEAKAGAEKQESAAAKHEPA